MSTIDRQIRHARWFVSTRPANSWWTCNGPDRSDREQLKHEVAAWQRQRNDSKGIVDWQFTTPDARVKLERIYPVTENNIPAP